MELELPLLWITLLAPIAVAAASPALGERASYLALAAALLLPAAILTPYALEGQLSEGVIDPVRADFTRVGIGNVMLAVDGFSYPFVIGVSIVTALVSVYSYKYMSIRLEEMREKGEDVPGHIAYLALYSIFAVSMLGMAYSTNFLLFFIFLEISLIASFLLIAFYGYGDRRRIALLYFVWTHIAGALTLLGGLYYVVNTGSFDSAVVSEGRLVYVSEAVRGTLATLAGASLLVGLLIKMAVFGVHMWLPYAHAEAPTPISALLSPNLIGLGGYGLVRFAVAFYPSLMESIQPLLVGLSFATILYGGLVALTQLDFKRFLAYSSISQMGYMLLGISALNPLGFTAASLIFLGHAIGKAVLFMVAGVFIAEQHGLRNIARMGGLAKIYPLMAATAVIGFLHLAGIPPAFGFWGELYLTISVLESPGYSGSLSLALLSMLLIASFTVTAAYSFITTRRIFFAKPRSDIDGGEVVDDFKMSVTLLAVLGIFMFLTAGLAISGVVESSQAMFLAYLS
ncbi:MAG: complex I subunit 5 family protein [Aeropyrum sp.]|nr:complex I subunit 5 family protein [Aeropyrum sp.]MCE4616829.1 complex I subunit 5 family protein [Aeropyrum sp.]